MAETSHIGELRAKAKFVTPDGKEICVVCHEETDVDFATPVDQRQHYVRGCGQHCEKCCQEHHLCGQGDLAP